MSQGTHIQWTDATWVIAAGCNKVSKACRDCWAIVHAWRLAHNPNEKIARNYRGTVMKVGDKLNWTGKINPIEDRLNVVRKWKPQRIFVDSMSDIFHKGLPDDFRDMAFHVMADCPHHTFQLLTKRIDEGERYLQRFFPDGVPSHIHVGVSIADEEDAVKQLPILAQVKADVRWVSYEPALGRVNWHEWFRRQACNWVVVGGESRNQTAFEPRPFNIWWARELINEARLFRSLGVRVFVKQLGACPIEAPRHDGATGYQLKLKHKAGGNWDEWPEDLRVREIAYEKQ